MKIRVLKGYLAHDGEMYGKGEVVDIKKKEIALSLLESEKFESAENDPVEVPEPLEVVPDEVPEPLEVVPDEPEEEMELPEVDAEVTVKK